MIRAVEALFKYREKFVIIGLTGRTGSGCSTVAKILSLPKDEIMTSKSCELPQSENEKRKHEYLIDYFKANWNSFFTISLRDIITTYILECQFDEISALAKAICRIDDIEAIREDFNAAKNASNCLEPIYKYDPDLASCDDVFYFLSVTLPNFTKKLKEIVDTKNVDMFVTFYQAVGNNIRSHGDALSRSEILFDHVFCISDRTNQIIKCLRRYNDEHNRMDYFVIDAFRNPIEVKFFQERYTAFYLWAVSCPDDDRIQRLNLKDLSNSQIEAIDSREYPEESILSSHARFISQSIQDCLQIADVHITNPRAANPKKNLELADQLVRYVSLVQHPGLVTPSRDERCMQVAYTAKLNSGCISRQVGAVVVDNKGFVRSIGWNDSPQGQTPCLLRRATDLDTAVDKSAFSDYELTSVFCDKIKKYLSEYHDLNALSGLPICYCFKDIHNKKNQVHTRSLHAEENAFLALVGHANESIRGGTLYSTASPCDLCSKKAFQLGISRIVFIDLYPGIAIKHILCCGEVRPTISLFSGAVGSAYFRLYMPIVSYKDELLAYRQNL